MSGRKHLQSRKPDPPPAAMLSVTAGTTCIGFILNRGKLGFEAFTADAGKSLGMFQKYYSPGPKGKKAALPIERRKSLFGRETTFRSRTNKP